MKRFLTVSSLKFLLKIVKVSNKHKGAPYGHAMEEFCELSVECSKMARGIGRPDKFREELADVFFSMLRLMLKHNITMNDLIDLCTLKTLEKFPEQIEEVNND